MNPSGDRNAPEPSPVNETYVENLDALTRDLADIEDIAAAALAGDPLDRVATARISQAPTGLTYEELSLHNQQRRDVQGWGEVTLADLLDPTALRQIDEWRTAHRLRWEHSDLFVVGMAGLLGALGNFYDTQVDTKMLAGLSRLKDTDLISRWERDAKGMPIDYMGSNFGGRGHRGLSAGHDIGRFFNALNQVRTGTFEGTYWEDGERILRVSRTTPSEKTLYPVLESHHALTLLLKHWAADFVTPMSLPLPCWTLLRDMPNRELRKFGQEAYVGDRPGSGLNLRSGALTPGLGMVTTEVIIRTHTHLAFYAETGSFQLPTANSAKRSEMLLAAHAAAGAVSLSKTAVAAAAGETAVAVRHLNVPVLMRIGMLALTVRSDAATRAAAGPSSWSQLLEDEAATWTLPEAIAIAELLEVPWTSAPAP